MGWHTLPATWRQNVAKSTPTWVSPLASAFAGESQLAETTWTRLRSQGGLSIPSPQWMAMFRRIEAAFCLHHFLEPDFISRRPRVVEELVEVLCQDAGLPDVRIVRRFIRLRTFIRVSHINRVNREEGQVDDYREGTKRKQFAN